MAFEPDFLTELTQDRGLRRLVACASATRQVPATDIAVTDQDDPAFRLRRMRRTSVKGYRHLEPWKLRRPRGEDLPPGAPAEKGEDVRRVVDEVHARAERSVAAEDVE